MRWLKLILFILLSLPLAWLPWAAWQGQLGANPIEALLHGLGHGALRLLLLTLLLGTLAHLASWRWPLALRRMVGLFAFSYALLHLLVYLGLDQFMDLRLILEDLRFRPYILFGLAAWLLLLALTVTSTRGWRISLGYRWVWLHRLIYLAIALALTHHFMVAKSLSQSAMLYTTAFTLLVVLRILPIGKKG